MTSPTPPLDDDGAGLGEDNLVEAISARLDDVRAAMRDMTNASNEAGDPAQVRTYADLTDTVEVAQALIKQMGDARRSMQNALLGARVLLVCPQCYNGRGITTIDDELNECPTCHGEHRNSDLVKQIDAALSSQEG